MKGALSLALERYQRFHRRRWVRRYALAIVRHSAIGWDEAVSLASTTLDTCPGARHWVHPTDAALIELGIQEADLYMSRYDLQQAATLLGTGRTTLCRELRDHGILDEQNLPAREHVSCGRFFVDLKAFQHPGLGEQKPYGKTLVTQRGLLWLAHRLGREVTTTREAANDDQA